MEDHIESPTMEDLIEQVMRHDPDVTEALLYNFRHDDITEDRTLRLIQGLQGNPHVTLINFYHATPTQRVCREMCSLFRENTTIEHVKVPKGMNNEQLAPFCESLRENNATAVKHLDLGSCDLRGREGGEIVASLLRDNKSITAVDLYANERLGPEGASRIAEALRDHNRTLKKLHLAKCGVGNEGLSKLYFDWYWSVSFEAVRSVMRRSLLENDTLTRVRCDAAPGAMSEERSWQHGPRPGVSVIPPGVPLWSYLVDWCNHRSNRFPTTGHWHQKKELSKVQLSLTFHVLRTFAEEIFGTCRRETQTEKQPSKTQIETPSAGTQPERQIETQMEGQQRETMTETQTETQAETITEAHKPVQQESQLIAQRQSRLRSFLCCYPSGGTAGSE